MAEYKVQIDNNNFLVSVKQIHNNKINKNENRGDSISYEAVKLEYEHCI